MFIHHLKQDTSLTKKKNNNHVASCLKQRESVLQILRLSSGPSNLLLILPAVKSECDMFSKRKDDLLGWSLTVPIVPGAHE